jgi:hypothetical protein
MNFLAILKQLFSGRPSLEEFITMHNPQNSADVERLEKSYHRVVNESGFFQ